MEEQEEKLRCPRCNSSQLTADKRGYNAGKAVAGAVLTGGVGLLAGLHGKDKLVIYCMACGEKWKPSEYSEKKKKFIREEKLVQKAANQKLRKANRERFFWLFTKRSKQEALEFAKENRLVSNGAIDADKLYERLKKEENKETVSQIVAAAIFIAVILFFIYQCSN